MTQEVTTALIVAGGTIVVAIIGVLNTVILTLLQRRVRVVEGHSAAARVQVENSHGTNLRDDLDRLGEALRGEVQQVRTSVSEDIEKVRDEMSSGFKQVDKRFDTLDREQRAQWSAIAAPPAGGR